MNIKKILLPVDGSSHSDAAAHMAIDIAASFNASVLILYVRRRVPAGLGEPNATEYHDFLNKSAADVLAPYKTLLTEAEIDHQDMVVGGNVAEVIGDVARAEQCDVIVIGSKGKSELEGLVLGSVTHKVLNTTRCPVLVVK